VTARKPKPTLKVRAFPPPLPGTLIRLDWCDDDACRPVATWYIRVTGHRGPLTIVGKFMRIDPPSQTMGRGTPWDCPRSFWKRGNVTIIDKVPPRKKATK
jgi:hypothetical protein